MSCTDGALLASSDAADVRWFGPQELPELKLAADTLAVIQKAFETQLRPGTRQSEDPLAASRQFGPAAARGPAVFAG